MLKLTACEMVLAHSAGLGRPRTVDPLAKANPGSSDA